MASTSVPTRRSTRKRGTAPTLQNDDLMEVDACDHPQDEDFAPVPKPKKQTRKKRKVDEVENADTPTSRPRKPRRMKGSLSQIASMPIDIVFEIFGWLKPLDLLHLARTEKALRDMLMSKSAQTVWQAARTNVEGLPPCPEDLSEPQYAELIFCTHCSLCLNNRVTAVHVWNARLRVCSRCAGIEEYFDPLCFHSLSLPYPQEVQGCLPTIFVGQGRHEIILVHMETVNEWKHIYEALPAQKQDEWVKETLEAQMRIAEHAKLCVLWLCMNEDKKTEERLQAISDRKDIVLQKLRSMGWGEEIDKQNIGGLKDMLSQNPSIGRALRKVLSDKVLQNLEPHLTDFMEGARIKRIKAQRKKMISLIVPSFHRIYLQYVASLPKNCAYPPATEAFFNPRIYERLVELGDLALAGEQDLPLDFLQQEFPTICSEWEEASKAKLVELALEGLKAVRAAAKKEEEQKANPIENDTNGNQPNISKDQLALLDIVIESSPEEILNSALVQFHCDGCYGGLHSYMVWRRVLMHRCTRFSTSLFKGHLEGNPEERLIVWRKTNDGFWETSRVKLAKGAVFNASAVVMICGFSEGKTTHREMDEQAPMLECLSCHSLNLGRLTLKWDSVHHHFDTNHEHKVRNPVDILKILGETESNKVRQAMKEAQERKYSMDRDPKDPWVCTVDDCSTKGPLMQLKKHIMTDHNKDPEDGDMVLRLDVSPLYEPYRLWPPRLVDELAFSVETPLLHAPSPTWSLSSSSSDSFYY